MTLETLFGTDLICDNTKVVIRDAEFHVLAVGNWYQDNILDFTEKEIESFTWQDDNKIYVDIKGDDRHDA